MTNNQLAENSVIQLLNSVRLARDNAERADNRVDHSFYYALTIALEELQERRKAERDSKPVAVPDHLTYLQNPTLENVLSDAEENSPMAHAARILAREVKFWRSAPLYRHAQPAPVVLKDHQIRELVNQLRDIAIKYHAAGQLCEQIARVVRAAFQAQLVCTCPSGDGSLRWPCPAHPGNPPAHSGLRPEQSSIAPAQDGNSPVIPDDARDALTKALAAMEFMGDTLNNLDAVCSEDAEFVAPAFEAVRLVLAAAPQPQNAPQNIPETIPGWIPVSERMPDETQPVIVVSEGGVVQRAVYQFCEGVWSDWYDLYDDVNIEAFTHWMPLPSAPQEVK